MFKKTENKAKGGRVGLKIGTGLRNKKSFHHASTCSRLVLNDKKKEFSNRIEFLPQNPQFQFLMYTQYPIIRNTSIRND